MQLKELSEPKGWKWDKENYPEFKAGNCVFRGGYANDGKFYEQKTQNGKITYYKDE